MTPFQPARTPAAGLLLLLLLAATTLHPASSAGVPPRGCKDKCWKKMSRAVGECNFNGMPIPICHVTTCQRSNPRGDGDGIGYKCAPLPSPSVMPMSPSPAPPSPSPPTDGGGPARGCKDKCWKKKSRAVGECNYRGMPLTNCEVVMCQRSNTRGFGDGIGYKCAPKDGVVDPSPSPSPSMMGGGGGGGPARGCRDRCYRKKSRAVGDCNYRGMPIEGCKVVLCTPTFTRGFGDGLAYKCTKDE